MWSEASLVATRGVRAEERRHGKEEPTWQLCQGHGATGTVSSMEVVSGVRKAGGRASAWGEGLEKGQETRGRPSVLRSPRKDRRQFKRGTDYEACTPS